MVNIDSRLVENSESRSEKDMSRDEWLEARKMGIGGSDAGAILGLNPYSSPTRVFLDKTGQAEPQADNYAMKIGRDLEDYVARLFTEETGKKVRRRNAMLINDSYPFAVANVDREVVGEKSLLECKTTSKLDPQVLIQQKKEIEREINMIDERAKMMMDEAEKAETDSWNISWKTQKRRTLDTNRIKTEDPELYDLYGKESESRVFRVTRKKNTRRKRING